MNAILSYLLKSLLCSGILVTCYWLVLRNKKMYSYNRIYLLLTVIFSLFLPILHFQGLSLEGFSSATFLRLVYVLSGAGDQPLPLHFTWEWAVFTAVLSVSLLLLIRLFLRIRWIYRARGRYPVIPMKGFKLIETQMDQAPFSFLDNLFWREDISRLDPYGEKIFQHELIHIRGKHTYDKLFLQVIVCICWINPFYWLVQKELNLLHEFIADEGSIKDGGPALLARLLLLSCNEGKSQGPYHSFFTSQVKRRLFMISGDKRITYPFARRAGSLGVTLLLVLLFSFTSVIGKTKIPLPPHSKERRSAASDFAKKRLDEAKASKGEIYTVN
ncbi:M56 family metallopeptidase [Flavitalea flava]